MDHSEILADIKALLASLKSELPPASHEMVEGLVAHGEPKVAIEILCEHLNELGVVPDAPVYSQLMRLISKLGLGEVYGAMVPRPDKPRASDG